MVIGSFGLFGDPAFEKSVADWSKPWLSWLSMFPGHTQLSKSFEKGSRNSEPGRSASIAP